MRRLPALLCGLLLTAPMANAEVVRIDIQRRDTYGSHERIIARVHFAVRPSDPANARIADIRLAPVNQTGLVEFSSDLLFFQPRPETKARGTVFLEVVNRGRDQSLGLLSKGRTTDFSPEAWDLGDRFLLEQGFAVAFLGWQFDVEPVNGLTFTAPTAAVEGDVRASFVEDGVGQPPRGFAVQYCAADPQQPSATLTYRARFEDAPQALPRESWQFAPDGCGVVLTPMEPGLYEAIYRAKGSPIAGLGLAAIRDFASYLRYGGPVTTLRENPALVSRVIGFGYSQSGRLLRDFLRDGFNADERGRQAFNGLFIAAAGAGGGSFNHRFAMPGQAGNSVLSALRPVDLPPFTDDGLLARAEAARVTPRIFYTLTSTEYWARGASLTHTSDDGMRDMPFASSARAYLLSGTAHASGPMPPRRDVRYRGYQNLLNFAEQRWGLRALLLDLDEWLRGIEPPPSRVPSVARGELVPHAAVRFPKIPQLPFAPYVPPIFRMDLGSQFASARVVTEPPVLGAEWPVRVPQVNADGNDVGGIALPEVAVPLGTFTGWNVTAPQLPGLRYLAGLIGSFEPFPRTREERMRTGDERLSIEERYMARDDYLAQVRKAAAALVHQRFMLASDVEAAVAQAVEMWTRFGNSL